jgi:hypothetical protein
MGSPSNMATWIEEGLNGDLKPVCAGAHQANFPMRVLHEFRTAYGPIKRKRARE